MPLRLKSELDLGLGWLDRVELISDAVMRSQHRHSPRRRNIQCQISRSTRLTWVACGKRAWRQNLGLAAMSAGKVESTLLGPRGAYKMVTFNRGPERIIKVTKDAVEMLKELQVQYPAVMTLSEAAKLHREEVGDGITTMVLILAALLRESEVLMDRKREPSERDHPRLSGGDQGGHRRHREDRRGQGRLEEPDNGRRRVRKEAPDAGLAPRSWRRRRGPSRREGST